MRLEEKLSNMFTAYLPLALPILNLFMRFMLNIASRDLPGILRRIFSLPEDLIFLAMGLELAGIAGVIPNFTQYYVRDNHDPVLQGIVVLVALFCIAILSHWWSRTQVQVRFQNVFISGHEVERRIKKARKTKSTPAPSTREYFLLFHGDYILGFFLWGLDLGVGVYCLYYVTKIIVS